MDFRQRLEASAKRAGSWLCVGLDPDPVKFPQPYTTDDTLAWCLDVVEQVADVACAIKPNAAFFEALGDIGHDALVELVARLPPHLPCILDGKRNDIGHSAVKYAEAAFDELGADAVTVTPYLGRDTVDPFASYEDKGVFLLARTSNASAGDLQDLLIDGVPLYRHVARLAMEWDTGNLGLVAGATYPEELQELRDICGDGVPLLIPGVGAQGADAAKTLRRGGDSDGAYAVVNVGRAITYADDPRAAARTFATQLPYGRAG